MACPYFYPVARLEEDWAVPPRLPLGDGYNGECRCGPTAFAPDDAMLRACCNTGYARGKCDRFPNAAPSDAVRFHVASDSDNVIGLEYTFEKGCWPTDHGAAGYSIAEQAFSGLPADEVLHRQAAAFMESYLRRAR